MDGRELSAEFRKRGLKPIKAHTTIIRGYNTFSSGDYRIYTEKSFGLFGLSLRERIRNIECTTESYPIILEVLTEKQVKILADWHYKFIVHA